MKKNLLSVAVKGVIGLTAAAVMVPAMPAFAQEDAQLVEEVLVTGSRIQRADLEGANPVTVLSREDLVGSGELSVGDILQNLPSSAGAATNTGVNNGGSGAVRFSLRGLGSERTLVLINGRRAVASGLGADSSVDLNNIPVAMIERVEVLKDGASAVYGSDAIAGVVNIITRDNFEGAEFSTSFGETSEGDGRKEEASFTFGTSTDNGNFVVSGYYADQQPIWAGDREYSQEEIWFHPYWDPQGQTPGGSSATPWGNHGGSDGNRYTQGPEFGDWRTYNGATDAYNYAPANYTQTPNERWGVSAFGNYNLGDLGALKNVEASAEFMYTHRGSQRLIAPEPLAPLAFFGHAAPYSDLNYYNQQFGPKNADGETMVLNDWRRRMVETGGRDQVHETNTHQITLALAGELGDWNWDLSALYGENDANIIDKGYFNLERVAEAVGPTFVDSAGNVLCSSDGTEGGVIDGCVPLNVFGVPGTDTQITAEMLEYISGNYVSITEGGNDMSAVQFNIGGNVIDLPAGPLGMAFGLEHRKVSGFSQPDSLQLLGTSTAGSSLATGGSYHLNEAFVEFAVPLLEGLPAINSLELSVASRYSDYSTFGETTNSKVGLRWSIVDDLTVRTTVSEAFRAPSIPELYQGISSTFPNATDKCANDPTASCIADGVPTGGYSDDGIIQIPSKIGGNPDLQPETADIFTVGLVYQPSWLDGASLTVDYWETEVENMISTSGPQVILDNCWATGQDCDKIDRWAAGSGAEVGGIIFIHDLNTNVGGLSASGVDLSLRYQMPGTSIGLFGFGFDAAYVTEYDKTLSNGDVVSHAGRFEDNQDGNFPRWKTNFTTNWSYENWDASFRSRYIHSVMENLNGWYNLDPVTFEPTNEPHEVDSQVIHDIQLSYNLADYKTRLTFGIDNVTDEQPPFAYTGFNDNTDVRTYETQGRYYYGRVNFNF
ncbi:TonB-dependent receptor plug domain-containing protein [Microbulbifer marinus]|uniref:TonB-dependent Receptor Plug Domain n=1 Tax=Microbulbifer marinus TaxID=658218 RepID=A0A1H4AFI3_9GAMM|nr:TonB-dependent receptor [Microbulbifer marinus]SEA34843.1 TonB-dependent Receptor Plug Domain [Microbulbifer marinus]